MLILTRKLDERIRILCPDGKEIWITAKAGYLECEDDEGILIASPYTGSVYYDFEKEGEDPVEVEIVYRGINRYGQYKVGIIAPMEYKIAREELIND